MPLRLIEYIQSAFRFSVYEGGDGLKEDHAAITKRKKNTVIYLMVLVIGVFFLTIFLWYQGFIIPNARGANEYPIKGVDVSAYQGEIAWDQLEKQDMRFAFIKATEGSKHVDRYFEMNWHGAKDTKLRIGAYHFFSFDSDGKTQGEHFINTVPADKDSLPPVIDVEFYGYKEEYPPDAKEVKKELSTMVRMLEDHYGKRVIIYTTSKAYNLYIKNHFEDCDIWIRDVYGKPSLPDERKWTFWQYTDRERLDGYDGEEKFIDVNVFNGDEETFREYGR